MNIIYGLIDPRTSLVRYIGKSTSGMTRPREHGLPCRERARTYVANWVKSLKRLGLEYIIVVLEEAPADQLPDVERWWIAYGRASSWPLTNLTDGGEGATGRVLTAEQREVMSRSIRLAFAKPEVKERNVSAVRAAMQRPDVRASLVEIQNRPEVRAAKSAGMSGDRNPMKRPEVSARARQVLETPENLRMYRELLLNPEHPIRSAEARRKIGDANRRRTVSPGTRAKMSASQRARFGK